MEVVGCLSAPSSVSPIFFFYLGIANDQSLGVSVYCIPEYRRHVSPIINFLPLPLSSKSTLSWIGYVYVGLIYSQIKSFATHAVMRIIFWIDNGCFSFTVEGTICFMDSAGILSILNKGFNMSWLPIANMKELVSFLNEQNSYMCLPYNFAFSLLLVSHIVILVFNCRPSENPTMFGLFL